MKLFFVLMTSLTLFACGASSTKGKWNEEDRKEALKDVEGLDNKSITRSKNMFSLGMVYWMYDRSLEHTVDFFNKKFKYNLQNKQRLNFYYGTLRKSYLKKVVKSTLDEFKKKIHILQFFLLKN